MTNLTIQEVSELTNPELDECIVKAMHPEAKFYSKRATAITFVRVYCDDRGEKAVPNISANWAILMPLVIEHGISLDYVHGQWWCGEGDYTLITIDKPQRTLAECLLLVLQSERNEL